MNDLTRDACAAFIAGADFTRGNMHVYHNNGGRLSRMLLCNNVIAERNGQTVRITLAGHPTPTTRARLNGLLELLHKNRHIYLHKKVPYIANTASGDFHEISAHEWITL